jgi:HAD superfamily hydrolase (TIGR01509 family)
MIPTSRRAWCPTIRLRRSEFDTERRGLNWELIIFDCDGVLVDSEPIQNRVFARMLQDIGLMMSDEEHAQAFIGRSMADCLEIAEQLLGRALPPGFEGRLQAQTFDAFERELRSVPGVEQALDQITAPVCVASSGSVMKMRKTLALTGLLPRFAGRMFSATKVPRGKPHPDLFLYAAREMGAAPADCAVIEDSVAGVQAGVAAGMIVLGYARTSGADALATAGAQVFNDMCDLPSLLQKAWPPSHGRRIE